MSEKRFWLLKIASEPPADQSHVVSCDHITSITPWHLSCLGADSRLMVNTSCVANPRHVFREHLLLSCIAVQCVSLQFINMSIFCIFNLGFIHLCIAQLQRIECLKKALEKDLGKNEALFGISAVLCTVRPHREDGNWLLSQG